MKTHIMFGNKTRIPVFNYYILNQKRDVKNKQEKTIFS